jgi:hypothetical protein
MNYAQLVEYSIVPADLIKFLLLPIWNFYTGPVTGDVHIVGFYFGVTVLVLVIIALVNRDSRKKVAASVIVAAIVFLLSLGDYLPGYKILIKICYPLRFFRFPAQIIFMCCFIIPVVAAVGLDKINNRVLKCVLLTMVFCELALFGTRANMLIDKKFFTVKPDNVSFIKQDKDGLFRIMLTPRSRKQTLRITDTFDNWIRYKNVLYPNIGMAHGIYDASGFEELRLARYDEVWNMVAQSPGSKWIDLLNIRYMLSFWEVNNKKFVKVKDGELKIYKNTGCLPRAFLVPQYKVLPKEQVLAYVETKEFDPLKTVLMEQEPGIIPEIRPARRMKHKLEQSEVKIIDYNPNRILIEVNTPIPQWLVVSDTYFPGWTVCVNGVNVRIYRANYIMRAVHIDAGRKSIVEFEYKPQSFYVGLFISLVCLIVGITYLLL